MRIFSQQEEISQLTGHYGREISQSESNNNNNMDERFGYDEALDDCSQHPSESQFSNRAQALCEENRQIDHIVESQLLVLEKRRLLLAHKVGETKKGLNKRKDKHECQSQKSLKLQMSLEEYTEKYQMELAVLPKLEDK